MSPIKKYEASQMLLKALNAKLPVIQAPMAGISTPKLSSVVTKHGGIGSLAFGSSDLRNGIEPLVDIVREFEKQGGNLSLVNFNFFCNDYKEQSEPTQAQKRNWVNLMERASGSSIGTEAKFQNGNISLVEIEKEYPLIFSEFLDLLAAIGPKIVSFHFGHVSSEAISRIQENGTLVFATATSLKEAKYLHEIGIQGLILQGYEAGGHRGNFLESNLLDQNLSTFSLFSQVKRHFNSISVDQRPYLVPTGGIYDGKITNYYLSLGASAVQVGSLFLNVPESNSKGYVKKSIISGEETVMIPLVSGKIARAIKTDFIKNLLVNFDQDKELHDQPSYGWAYYAFKHWLSKKNDSSLGFYLAGQNYQMVDPTLTTEQQLQKLKKELEI